MSEREGGTSEIEKQGDEVSERGRAPRGLTVWSMEPLGLTASLLHNACI